MKVNTTVWIVLAVLVAAALIGSWALSSVPGASPSTDTTQTVTPPKTTGTTGTKPATTKPGTTPAPIEKVYASGLLNLTELLKLEGANYSCTFSVSQPMRSGKFYLSGKKWRGDFATGVSMIDDGKYIYVWNKGATEGLKVIATSGVAGSAINQAGGIDIFTPLSYKCNIWATTDMSVYTPPSITFKNSEGFVF